MRFPTRSGGESIPTKTDCDRSCSTSLSNAIKFTEADEVMVRAWRIARTMVKHVLGLLFPIPELGLRPRPWTLSSKSSNRYPGVRKDAKARG